MSNPLYVIKAVILSLIVFYLDPVNNAPGQNSDKGPNIDEEHMKIYPDCGIMPTISASRIINSQEAKVHYPWIVLVIRYWKGTLAAPCGGTIITKRYTHEL